jgi:phage terminase large subunit GpA-like protein
VLPVLYHAFEIVEPVVVGAPSMAVNQAKYFKEILPAIEKTRFANLLPRRGAGSQGGWSEEVELANGGRIKFMAAGGGDAQRASYTARVTICTEVDKMDTAGAVSREADPVSQIEDRTLSYDDAERFLSQECTVSLEQGLIWRSHLAGTQSRIAGPCPHCGRYVTPEREHLRGWAEAETVIEARKRAHFICPKCEGKIDDAARETMNRRAVLVHRGQTVTKTGKVRGSLPPVELFSVRWNAFNNLFWSIGSIAVREWKALHQQSEEAEENDEKTLCQKVWAIPYQPPEIDLTPLSAEAARNRTDRYPRGIVPSDAKFLAAGLDLGKWLCHYQVIAQRSNGRLFIDYNVIDVDSDRLGTERGLILAMNEFRDLCLAGWAREGGGTMAASQAWIDSGSEWADTVYAWCRENREGTQDRFRPTKGYGARQKRNRVYRAPDKRTSDVRLIGDGFHLAQLRAKGVVLVHVNADAAKIKVQEALALPAESPGACHVFHAPANQHIKWSKHMTAEKPAMIYDPQLGEVMVMELINKSNHYLDAGALAWKACDFVAMQHAIAAAGRGPGQTTPWATARKRR